MGRRRPSEVNLLLAVDKPVGISSHDVVSRVRRALDERRVGHAGTLDPLASGVMVVGVGQATRLLGRITLARKGYIARIAFGSETNTDDAEGEVVRSVAPTPELSDAVFAREALRGFVGPQEQVPPAFSAISVGGVRSYKRARSGEDVKLPPRSIEVFSAEVIGIETVAGGEGPVWTVSFDVSKGTYIRALARDLGRACGGAAHLCDLRRTSSGTIGLRQCVALDSLDRDLARERCLDPVSALGYPAFDLSDSASADVLLGRPVAQASCRARGRLSSPKQGDPVALLHDGELRAIAVAEGARCRMDDVFPQGIGGAL